MALQIDTERLIKIKSVSVSWSFGSLMLVRQAMKENNTLAGVNDAEHIEEVWSLLPDGTSRENI